VNALNDDGDDNPALLHNIAVAMVVSLASCLLLWTVANTDDNRSPQVFCRFRVSLVLQMPSFAYMYKLAAQHSGYDAGLWTEF